MTFFNPSKVPDIKEEFAFFEEFFSTSSQQKYSKWMQEISNRTRETFDISLDDILEFENGGKTYIDRIQHHAIRYLSIFYDVIDKLLPPPTVELKDTSRADVYMTSRELMIGKNRQLIDDEKNKIPKELKRRYEIRLIPLSNCKPLTVRTINADHIGRLTTLTGMVTRVTNVKPLLFVAAYTCDACGFEFFQPIRSKQYMPLITCQNQACTSSDKVHMQTRASKFLKYQEITLQESPDQVPVGGIPRSMVVNLRSSSVRTCTAGDRIIITGVFLPLQLTGFRALKAGLTSATVFETMKLERLKKGYALKDQTVDLLEQVDKISKDPNIYDRLASSIAPEIFGHLDVKKALLLMMIGGVTKRLEDGMTIRGDINILLMGDPGVAKSQLLKHIAVVAPRAVYTTGKGSSGVGLTAAVLKDPISNEMVLEGGALVLSDMGICCIDEFDKMEEADRTAIHEVMEQQSVSIAKAGICTTLNARTSILAAANPAYGRYNKRKSPESNIVLPAALMSRFDLLFVMIDSPQRDFDINLARHICYVHQNLKPPPKSENSNNTMEIDETGESQNESLRINSQSLDILSNKEPLSAELLRAYISRARQYNPSIPKFLTQSVVGTYIGLRTESRNNNARSLLATPRTLLSILRLSQALARLKFSNEVTMEDLEEATRLMHVSKQSIRSDDEEQTFKKDSMSRIFNYIKDYMQIRNLTSIRLVDVIDSLKLKGFNIALINQTLEKYQELDIWMIDSAKTKLTLID